MYSLSPFLVFMASSFLKIIPISPTYGGLCFITISLKTSTNQI
ncbi:hypothetical protein HMPREF1451_01545 [Helicobacter pylori HP260BFii]|uniref:Uncharacterized protein n=1 Tax=Helicobacter pylori GAM260BSi TaxID=1159046 RepID=M3QUF6_HELPX|nr:hypothetical protein HMPREF1418_00933 [Helicobacter pylori GAM260BSi]EMH66296.1 hypothetical protein HMPREF1451_01545 [Helicobacter pylori HP260BFii]